MGDRVKGLVSGYIEELEGRASRRARKPVTFSMRLSEGHHARLVWLAEKLDMPKTPLAEELLKAAVDEAIGQYAEWAAPEDPEGFLEGVREEIEAHATRPGGPGERGPGGPGGGGGPGGPRGERRKPGPRHPG